jgi:hypothetical protein
MPALDAIAWAKTLLGQGDAQCASGEVCLCQLDSVREVY